MNWNWVVITRVMADEVLMILSLSSASTLIAQAAGKSPQVYLQATMSQVFSIMNMFQQIGYVLGPLLGATMMTYFGFQRLGHVGGLHK